MSAYQDGIDSDERYRAARRLGARSGAGFEVSPPRLAKELIRLALAALIGAASLGILILATVR